MSSVVENVEKREKRCLVLGLYLMTDAMLFASLFATYMILKPGTNGLPGPSELFSPSYVLIETIILLVSSFLCGSSNLALHHGRHRQFEWFLGGALLLGATFVALELKEFAGLVVEHNVPSASAFLSGFFTPRRNARTSYCHRTALGVRVDMGDASTRIS